MRLRAQVSVMGRGVVEPQKAVEPTQRRKGAETQGFRLLGAITHWVSHADLFFPRHLSVPCVFASWRLCVNCRFWVERVVVQPKVQKGDGRYQIVATTMI